MYELNEGVQAECYDRGRDDLTAYLASSFVGVLPRSSLVLTCCSSCSLSWSWGEALVLVASSGAGSDEVLTLLVVVEAIERR